MLGDEVVLQELDDPAYVWPTAKSALWELDEVARIYLEREVPSEEVFAQTLRRPDDRTTLQFARVTVTLLGWSRRARQEAYNAELVCVV